jgi:nitrile hydratase
MRYFVMPARPAGTEGLTEQQLADLVTRESIIGVAQALVPGQVYEPDTIDTRRA